MLIYKIFRAPEWAQLQADGETAGAPIDLADGYIHTSTAAQVEETAAKHFAGVDGLVLLALEAEALGDKLVWEPSRGGALFPHLYRRMTLADVVWSQPLPLAGGVHKFSRAVNRLVEQAGLRALRLMDPERAHGLALQALQAGFGPKGGPVTSDRLRCKIAGIDLPNPVGLAAGFDKNAVALDALAGTGFGFIEVGAATPLPQPGNPRPRLFRLAGDRAAINRFGFNNDGMAAIGARLKGHRGVVGLNLGANKDSADRAGDFAKVLAHCGADVEFVTVNVSSPNTEKLRDLQGKEALEALLAGVKYANRAEVPIFLKIAPDLSEAELQDVAEVANAAGIAGLIATNTTLDREGLHGPHKAEKGGLSGQPLFEKSTRVLARLAGMTDLPIIGVGGVGSAEQAYAKIRAGASAVQLYTALVYEGVSLAGRIAEGLDVLLARDGFANVAEAVGTGREDWL